MNSACTGEEDGSTELHTVAVRENKQYRNRTKALLLRTGAERAGRAGPGTVQGGGCLHPEEEGAGQHRSRNLHQNTDINVHHQPLTGTGEQGLPLATRGAAFFARAKMVLLRCLPLSPTFLVRQR